jgi:hypothetical protein
MKAFARLALFAAVLSTATDLCGQLPNGSDFRVNLATLESQDFSRVAVSGDTIAVAFGRVTNGATASVRFFDRAAQPITGDVGLAGLGGTPAITGVPGGFVVVYQAVTGNSQIFARRFDTTGVPIGGEFRVNQYTGGTHGSPSVSAAADGGFVIAWSGDGTGDDQGIFAARFDANANRLADDFLVNTYTTGNQFKPSVAVSGSGEPEFLVVWAGVGSGDPDGIFARRYALAGAALTSDFRVNEATTGSSNYPSAAAHPNGAAFLVAWQQTDGATNIFAQRYGKFGLPTGETQVTTAGLTAQPSAAYEASGSFVIAYNGVRARRYASSGSPVGDEFLVSTYTTGNNQRPSVAAFAPGNFIVTWTNSVRDGSGSGIYGQRFGPRGDVNGDGVITVADIFYLINALFAGGAAPIGPADANSSGGVDVSDVFFLINYLFAGGAAPGA